MGKGEKLPPKGIAIVPVYNAGPFIIKTLQSLKVQTYANLEVLVSDDCSTDDTVAVINTFIKEDERFTFIRQDENLGWVNHINFLLEKAVSLGDYTFILPHDDQIEADYVQKLIRVLEENPEAVLAYSDMRCGENVLKYSNPYGQDHKIKRVKRILKRKGDWWITYRGIARTSVVKEIIPLKKNFFGEKEYSVDWIWLLKLSLYGEIVRVPEKLFTKYFLDNNLSYKLTFTNRNYFGNLLNGSITLLRSPLKVSEQIIFQSVLLVQVARRLVRLSGLYPVFKKMKALFIRDQEKLR